MIKQTNIFIKGIKFQIPKAECNVCGAEWQLRKVGISEPLPLRCPRCGSTGWDSECVMSLIDTYQEIFENITKYVMELPANEQRRIISREEVRERDNNKCVACGRSSGMTEGGQMGIPHQRLECHHMDGDQNSNVGDNVVSLCQSCHRRLTKNNKYLDK